MGEPVGGRYEIQGEAGAGGMARVYRAKDLATGEVVAVKILNAATEHALRRFAREVSALTELAHPGIVRYVGHGETRDGHAFLAMEWLEGESLETRLERGPLEYREALTCAAALARALAAAHERGIVHRDLKPANIMLAGRDPARPKLLDFGLVRDLEATHALTSTGDLLGTPLYMAPEQASCNPALDARVDVYGIGAVLYACVTGRPPFVASTLVALLAKIVLEEPAPPSRLRSDVPQVVEQLLGRLLAKRRDERPADARAVVNAVDEALAGLDRSPRVQAARLPAREQRVCSIVLASSSAVQADATMDATLGSFGGALALADGSLMTVFDGPENPATLASRAARHALGLKAPDVAVSVVTGRAVLSGPTPMGEVIDRAAQQLELARGSVRIDRDTAGLIEGRFDLTQDEVGDVLGAERQALDSVRTLLGKPTRCIGRDRELAALEGYYDEVVAEDTARAVVVIAEPGIGKSRLALELERRLAEHETPPQVIRARCESITRLSPFAAITAALRDRPVEDEFLRELLGMPAAVVSDRLAIARENPGAMFDGIAAGWTRWLSTACDANPVVLVIEDLHWADESSMSLFDAALAALASRRFMVLALARPEVRERSPFATRRPHEVRLDPLGKRACERMIREALGTAAPDAMVAAIVARADGNALFVEELIRSVAHAEGGELPVGVIGTVQRRFDGLTPIARAALRAASIYGERFTAAGAAALMAEPGTVDAALDELVVEELVARVGEGFAFRHALVREAAYALLASDDRALGHALAGQYLAGTGTDDAAVIGRHFELGRRHADAAQWYATAAAHALARNDLTGALAHAERAQQWADDAPLRGTLELVIAEAQLWRGKLEETRRAAERAVSMLASDSASWFEAAGMIITSAGQVGDNQTVEGWLRRVMPLDPPTGAHSAYVLCLGRAASQLVWGEAVDLARQAIARADQIPADSLGPTARARLGFARAYEYMTDTRFDRCFATLAEVSAIYERAGARRDALQMVMLRYMLGMFAGELETAVPNLRRCAQEAERIGAAYLAEWTRWEIAAALFIQGDRDGGEAELLTVSAPVQEQPLFRDVRTLMRVWCEFRRDDAAAVALVLDNAPPINYVRFRAAIAAYDAYAAFAHRRDPHAVDKARAAIDALLCAPGLHADGCLTAFSPALETLVRAGAPDAAQVVRTHAARLERWAEALEPTVRTGFLYGVPWNAHVLALRDRLG